MSFLRSTESGALPEPEGFGAALRLSYLRSEPTGGAAPINSHSLSRSSCRIWSCTKVGAPARSGGVGAGHRLRGGSGRSNVLCLISRARLRDLRVLGTQFTSALILSHQPASVGPSVLLEAAAAHLQCSDRAADSELTLSSHHKHRRLPRRLRKRCVGSLSRAELSHSCDVPHRGARQGRAFGRLWRRRARPRRRERPVPGQGCVPTSRLHQPWPWGGRRGALGLAVCYTLRSDMF